MTSIFTLADLRRAVEALPPGSSITLSREALVFLSYSDGVDRRPRASARVAAGPFWASAAYSPERPVEVSGLVRVGDVQVFASRRHGAILIRPTPQASFTVAQTWATQRTVARLSVGPSPRVTVLRPEHRASLSRERRGAVPDE